MERGLESQFGWAGDFLQDQQLLGEARRDGCSARSNPGQGEFVIPLRLGVVLLISGRVFPVSCLQGWESNPNNTLGFLGSQSSFSLLIGRYQM
jgi:hypothetical protein